MAAAEVAAAPEVAATAEVAAATEVAAAAVCLLSPACRHAVAGAAVTRDSGWTTAVAFAASADATVDFRSAVDAAGGGGACCRSGARAGFPGRGRGNFKVGGSFVAAVAHAVAIEKRCPCSGCGAVAGGGRDACAAVATGAAAAPHVPQSADAAGSDGRSGRDAGGGGRDAGATVKDWRCGDGTPHDDDGGGRIDRRCTRDGDVR